MRRVVVIRQLNHKKSHYEFEKKRKKKLLINVPIKRNTLTGVRIII